MTITIIIISAVYNVLLLVGRWRLSKQIKNVVIQQLFIYKATYIDTIQINVAMEKEGVMASWKSNRGH